ncbi:MAG: hypothetical protein ACR2OY_07685 [Boseongicola sp.]
MDALTLIVQLVARTFFLAIPFGVAWLAFRRLALSETSNAWIYAVTGLFAAFTAAGLAPWALGLGAVGWLYFVFAALCPAVWVGVVIICSIGRSPSYESLLDDEPQDQVAPLRTSASKSRPLILEGPQWPNAPKPTFRHHDEIVSPANENLPLPDVEPEENVLPDSSVLDADRSVLEVARGMRGNTTSAARRLKPLLPAPDAMSDLKNLPFLKRTL